MYFQLSYLYLFLAGKHNCIHAKSRHIKRKVLYILLYQNQKPNLAGNKQLFHPSLPQIGRVFSTFRQKWTDLIYQRWTSKCLFPRRKIVYSVETCIIHRWKNTEKFLNWKIKIRKLKWKKENKKHRIDDFIRKNVSSSSSCSFHHQVVLKSSTLLDRRRTNSTACLFLDRTVSKQWFPDNSVFTSSGSSLCSNVE